MKSLVCERREKILDIKRRRGYILEILSLAEEHILISARLFITISCCLEYLLEVHLPIGILSNLSIVSDFRLCFWNRQWALSYLSCCSHLLDTFKQMNVIVLRCVPIKLVSAVFGRFLCDYAWWAASVHLPFAVALDKFRPLLLLLFHLLFNFTLLIYLPLAVADLPVSLSTRDYPLFTSSSSRPLCPPRIDRFTTPLLI